MDVTGITHPANCDDVMDTSDVDTCYEGKSLAPILWGDVNITNDVNDTGALVQVKRPGVVTGFSLVTKEYR